MKKITFLLIFFVVVIVNYNGVAQSFEDRYYSAEDYLEVGDYSRAINIYSELLEQSEGNANLNFKIGYCYVYTATQSEKAIAYLEFASKHISNDYNFNDYKVKSAPLEALFYLGRAYHLNYKFDKATVVFNELKSKIDQNDVALLDQINHELEACEVANEMIDTPVNVKITNVGKSINTKYDEHSPLISADNSTLIFTSKKSGTTGGQQTYDGQFFEDIYISQFDGNEFTKAKKISTNINTDGHDACTFLSHDGTQLILFTSKHDGGLSISTKTGSEWSVPKKLPGHINSRFRETSATLSNDNNTLYFTSDRKGGYGGLDIYKVQKLDNGKWGKVENLGSKINTKYDEEGPYVSQTGKHFFFSSKGHKNIGGFDIFVCALNDNGQWSTPKNVGYPINTPTDQVFETSTSDSKIFYFSSRAHKGYGGDDIFRVDLPENHIAKIVEVLAIDDPIVEASDDVLDMEEAESSDVVVADNQDAEQVVVSYNKSGERIIEREFIITRTTTTIIATGSSKWCWFLYAFLFVGISSIFFASRRRS